MLKTALVTFVLTLAACIDQPIDNGEPNGEPNPLQQNPSHEMIHAGDLVEQTAACAGTCYNIVVRDVWFSATRPDGSPWDLDGSLPDLYVVASVDGAVIGQTSTVLDTALTIYPTPESRRAHWGETVGTVSLASGNVVLEQAFDDSGYLAFSCRFTVQAFYLNSDVECTDGISGVFATAFPVAP